MFQGLHRSNASFALFFVMIRNMTKQKDDVKKPSTSRIWLILNVLAFFTVPGFCLLSLLIIRHDVQQALIADYRSTPGPWYQCAFDFSDETGRVILMRSRLPGIAGFHAEFGLRLHIELSNGTSATISLDYTEDRESEFYFGIAELQSSQRVPLLRVESYGRTYPINMTTLRQLSFQDVVKEIDMTFLGHFEGVDSFIPNSALVSPVVDHCGIISPFQ
jgi:hypothetical protein